MRLTDNMPHIMIHNIGIRIYRYIHKFESLNVLQSVNLEIVLTNSAIFFSVFLLFCIRFLRNKI